MTAPHHQARKDLAGWRGAGCGGDRGWQHTCGSALPGVVNAAAYLADRIVTGRGSAGSATAGVTGQPSRS